ncbi:MAG: methyltransferase domain-containing protein [Planctomycetia bacterium]|nr:methyltransferase domain-containing protein [Planctomycetia bacterium]
MTHDDFAELLEHPKWGRYYVGRWEYFKVAIDIFQRLNPSNVLELGPGPHTIVHGCDIMVTPGDDQWGRPANKARKVIEHDATQKPWPIDDKAYDLFIALQVWEHLDNKQSRAFREVMRISKTAVLSFPFMWDCPRENANYPQHHQIDRELIGDWTLNVRAEEIVEIPRTGKGVTQGPRLVYFWQFERA